MTEGLLRVIRSQKGWCFGRELQLLREDTSFASSALKTGSQNGEHGLNKKAILETGLPRIMV
jgi:hypothetical protein